MIWLTLRQFRTQGLATLAILATAAIYLLITGVQMRHTYATGSTACQTPHNQCGPILNRLRNAHSSDLQLFQMLMMAAPALIGIFWGAPLIAGEIEHGTHRMAWNQSITPTRWLGVKLAVIGIAAIAVTGAFSLLLTWWASPLDTMSDDRFTPLAFATRNIAPLGYTAFAFLLGAALGLLMRRALPAMAVTVAVFISLQVLFAGQLRPHLLPSTTASPAVNATLLAKAGGISAGAYPGGPMSIVAPGPAGAWIHSQTNPENSAGQEISGTEVASCFNGSITAIGDCLATHDLHISFAYQPASDYWPLQWYETGIYLALAAGLGGTCFWRIRQHRD
ncbi:hypothetical protein KGQ20_02605 [Catenulispora sp. NF23]|uniref:hypothetical protein n=1 Tax=Catenulispora pinistramenti TaxID=2705254 RepID=UPI001BA9E68A|nr:hypothetical protein [Catenulispora pinistramenti]MBS2531656.1 hypothetical protein [Catenulispora pinistramenti]